MRRAAAAAAGACDARARHEFARAYRVRLLRNSVGNESPSAASSRSDNDMDGELPARTGGSTGHGVRVLVRGDW